MERLEDIRDIRPVFELSDYYLYFVGAAIALIVLAVAGLLLYRYFKRPKVDLRAEYIRCYEAIDLEKSKEAAYEITRYARLVAASEREERMAEKLAEMLEPYKYVKEVPPLDERVRSHYRIFLDMIHE